MEDATKDAAGTAAEDEGIELADEQLERVAGGFVIELPEDDGSQGKNKS